MQINRILQGILPDSTERKLVILTGARQTGKTTLAKLKYSNLRYFNLDAPENRESIRAISSMNWQRDVGNAVIDEAQKEPTAFEKVKYSYDEKSITFTVMLGSSQILLLKKIRESLAGRVAIYELWPLLMCEIYGSKIPLLDRLFSPGNLSQILGELPGVLIDREASAASEAENYLLQWGGMPALLELENETRWKWLRDYTYTYLERDLVDLARLDDLEPFKKFQKLTALRAAKLLNYSELARDASVSVDTAKRYLEYLKLSYQVILLQPFNRNITSTVIKTPKMYWLDLGILRQLSGLSGEISGDLYENMVVAEIVKWMKTVQKSGEVYFYRTKSGLEADIILQTEHGLFGFEIKARQTVGPADIRPLREIAAKLGKEWRGGAVIYRGEEIRKIADPEIWAIPSNRLFT